MDTTTTIAVFGIAATCVFGGLTIWLARRRRYPGRITYFEEGSIGLFDAIVRNLEDLSVIYKNKPVSENIVLLKGYIVNTGTKDITPAMIEEPLALKLPEGFKWLDVKVVSSSTSIKAGLEIKKETSAEFDLGLFRVNEYVQFQALVEVAAIQAQAEGGRAETPTWRLKKALKALHRIADTEKTIVSKLPSTQSFTEFIGPFVFVTLIGLAFIGLTGRNILTRGGFGNKELHYLVTTQSGGTIETKISVDQDGMLVVKGVDTPLEQRQSAKDFFAGCNLTPKIVESSKSLVSVYLFSIFCGGVGVFLLIAGISQWHEYTNTRKVRSLLSLE